MKFSFSSLFGMQCEQVVNIYRFSEFTGVNLSKALEIENPLFKL